MLIGFKYGLIERITHGLYWIVISYSDLCFSSEVNIDGAEIQHQFNSKGVRS